MWQGGCADDALKVARHCSLTCFGASDAQLGEGILAEDPLPMRCALSQGRNSGLRWGGEDGEEVWGDERQIRGQTSEGR